MSFTAFIETQFPVSKLSKESYKERKANNSQTLTGLGKWWGRKPLVLVRATIVGLLLPATGDPQKDLDVFLRLMTMDEAGLRQRRSKSIPANRVAELLTEEERAPYFTEEKGKWSWAGGMSREARAELQERAFRCMGYDEQLSYCDRPEQIDGPSPEAWAVINAHCGTTAVSLREWVQQMGQKQFGHTPRVGDAFCGGGSIPFEAARLGCEAYGSDLNPVAALLTWASLNIIGGGEEVQKQVLNVQREAFEAADRQITEWGIEHNEKGWRADAYLYCVEAKSPATGYWVPLAPSWVISEKYKVCAVLQPDHANKRYHIEIITGANSKTFAQAKNGTVQNSRLICPETGQEFTISSIRGYGLDTSFWRGRKGIALAPFIAQAIE
jgi:adenine-specific DNA methylase